MSIPIAQLSASLASFVEQGSIPKLILINGNELLLIEETLDELRKSLKPIGFDVNTLEGISDHIPLVAKINL